jgi:AAA15 family ATPase/GTPase
MLLEFSLENFRSFKSEQSFSMLVDSNKSNLDPVFEAETADGKKIRLLKSAILYGSNASGKSNFIRAMFTLRSMIVHSGNSKIGEPIKDFEPFKFDTVSMEKPTTFKVEFIGADRLRYRYQVAFNRREIVMESLDFKPKGQMTNLFTRSNQNTNTQLDFHQITPGGALSEKRNLKKTVLKNQLFLSVFGSEPHSQLTPVFKYFSDWDIWNVNEDARVQSLKRQLAHDLTLPENEHLKARLSKLIKIADTKIEGISVREASDEEFQFPEQFSDALRRKIIEENRTRLVARHIIYENGVSKSEVELDFEEESVGTNVLFTLGGLILKKLEYGGLIVFDELDNSLHPRLAQFLVKLFSHPVANRINAQIVCASHEVLLLDKDIFRKDQVWITEKDKYGASEINRISDFEGVREDTPLVKWYMAGKFGGTPNIKEMAFIFDDHA